MTETKEIYLESLNRAIQFIENNLDKKILLKDVAGKAFLSEYHFHRIFKSLTGETVKEFLLRLKTERAAIRLKHSKDDIGQIALENGFENHETFTRAFKRYFQLSPQEYREAIQEVVEKKKKDYLKKAVNLDDLHVEEPIVKNIPDLHLAYIRHTGSYDKVASSFQRLMLWAATHLVLKLTPTTLGIVHDNPDLTDEEKIRFDACVILNKPIQPKGEIGYKKIDGGKFAIFRYRGAYENFYSVYDYIYNVCLFEKGWELEDKPALEWYIKSPQFFKPENYVTDFYVPIK
ncbi:AraC family transcriptional regulator [Aquiflexum balticum DSM 16537]|uniref:AraC family transcriptional regulator n=1 Tax=Aquiflexum balticum DSM 16537 TaxID=758820 RepID=A0A1W2H0S0_9BACT|nr:GyrI-like domain-containing protein [Aquiflexum balticum]SMD42535.1 AraC family transcriptional regulator [Aquiflexum balticum DSM 16537]